MWITKAGKTAERMDTGSGASATRGGQRDVIGEGRGEDKGT